MEAHYFDRIKSGKDFSGVTNLISKETEDNLAKPVSQMSRKEQPKKGAFFGSSKNIDKSKGLGEARMDFAVSGKSVPFQETFYKNIT